MKILLFITHLMLSASTIAAPVPSKYLDLIRYVQKAPDQGETNTCWFMASTGVMELLLNRKHNITRPKPNGPYDLSESFLIYQQNYYDPKDPQEHFIEEVIARWNHGSGILHKHWPVELGDDNRTAKLNPL